MYHNNDISRKQHVVNRTFKSLSCDIVNPVIKFPVLLSPINTEFASKFISRVKHNTVDYKYSTSSNRRECSANFISPDILSKYPCLNPMYKFNYKLSNQFVNDIYATDYVDDDVSDELDQEQGFQREQRSWLKNKYNNLPHSQRNIILMKGDVVNIDKKTLVFDKFNYKNHTLHNDFFSDCL